MNAPAVHEHPVQLTDLMNLYEAYRGGWKCDKCNREFDTLNPERQRGGPYHCHLCQFDVCHLCLRDFLSRGEDIPTDPSANRPVVSREHAAARPPHQPPTGETLFKNNIFWDNF